MPGQPASIACTAHVPCWMPESSFRARCSKLALRQMAVLSCKARSRAAAAYILTGTLYAYACWSSLGLNPDQLMPVVQHGSRQQLSSAWMQGVQEQAAAVTCVVGGGAQPIPRQLRIAVGREALVLLFDGPD